MESYRQKKITKVTATDLGKTGGVYIPPFMRARLETQIEGSYLYSTHRGLAAGATASVEVDAQQIALWTIRAPAQGAAEVAVDDAPWAVELSGDEAFGIAWCEEVNAGRHAVSLETTRAPAHLDALEIWRAGLAAPICAAPIPEEPRCACDSGDRAGSWWALVAAACGLRRRRNMLNR